MPVFDTAAHVWRSPSYRQGKAIELANVNKQLVNQQLEQEIEMAPEVFEQEKRQLDIREDEYELAFDKFQSETNENTRERTKDAAASAMIALEEGGDATAVFLAGLPEKEQPPEGFEFTESFGKQFLASYEKYQEVQAANAKWTADKNFVESLDSLSREEKDSVLEAIAKKKATVTGTTPDDPGVFGATTGDKTQDRMTREVVGGTENLLSSIDRIESQVGSMDQSAMGLPGAASKMIDNMASAVMGFADMVPDAKAQVGGQTVKESALLDAKLYQDMFSGPAAQSAALQANAIGLAYTLARAANPDGRISDADVRHQMKRVLLGGSSKTQILAAVTEVRREVMANMANYMRVNKLNQTPEGKEYYDGLMKKVDAIDNPQTSGSLPIVTSDADFAKLASGEEFVDEDGKRYRKP
jgi:hypothetical protein